MNKRDTGFFAILAAYTQYNDCLKKYCKTQVDALQKATASHREKIQALQTKLFTNKLTFDKFNQELTKITDEIKSLEESKNITDCSLSKCKKEFLNFLDTTIKEFEKNKTNDTTIKETIQQLKVIKKKVISDKLDQKDYDKLLKLMKKVK